MKLQDENLATPKEEVIETSVEVVEEAPVKAEPTKAQIDQWKREHGKVYKNVVDGNTYIWRRLKRSEYVKSMAIEGDSPEEHMYLRQNAIALAVTLFPSQDVMIDRIEDYAGLAGEISDRSVLKSGFQASETEEL